jgi:DNA-binding transcriptional MerR regulator
MPINMNRWNTAMTTTLMHTTAMVTRPAATAQYRISQAAALSGVTPANIRFYEKEKLFSPTWRGDNSYRMYSDGDVHQLRFIRACRSLDMSLDEVRTLMSLNLNSKADCATARGALDAHLGHVRARLAELKALEKDLKALRGRCDGLDTTCHIIEALHERADRLPKPVRTAIEKRHV